MSVLSSTHPMINEVNALLSRCKNLSNFAKLVQVNIFVNDNIRHMSDWDNYGVKDYYATPMQTIERRAGDCEDIAILKNWMLVQLGLKPRLAHCRIIATNRAHMISVCDGYTLDCYNVNPLVVKTSWRDDLEISVAFNSVKLWAAGKVYQMKNVKMSKYKDMLKRMVA